MTVVRVIEIRTWAEWEVREVRAGAVYVRVLGRDIADDLVELKLRLMLDQEQSVLEQLVRRFRARAAAVRLDAQGEPTAGLAFDPPNRPSSTPEAPSASI